MPYPYTTYCLPTRWQGVDAFPKPHQVKLNSEQQHEPLLLISSAWESIRLGGVWMRTSPVHVDLNMRQIRVTGSKSIYYVCMS